MLIHKYISRNIISAKNIIGAMNALVFLTFLFKVHLARSCFNSESSMSMFSHPGHPLRHQERV